jgi:hypothetical protein
VAVLIVSFHCVADHVMALLLSCLPQLLLDRRLTWLWLLLLPDAAWLVPHWLLFHMLTPGGCGTWTWGGVSKHAGSRPPRLVASLSCYHVCSFIHPRCLCPPLPLYSHMLTPSGISPGLGNPSSLTAVRPSGMPAASIALYMDSLRSTRKWGDFSDRRAACHVCLYTHVVQQQMLHAMHLHLVWCCVLTWLTSLNSSLQSVQQEPANANAGSHGAL